MGSYENYALQSFTVFEGSDPPAGLARFKVSRETALCRKQGTLRAIEVTVTSGRLFSRSLWLMSSVYHTYTHVVLHVHTATAKHVCRKVRPRNICAAHLVSFMGDADLLCTCALRETFLNVPLITFCLLIQFSV